MKNYDGILILEPEDTYTQPISATESRLVIREDSKPLYGATMAIAKTYEGFFKCLKSSERLKDGYTQSELQEIVDRCENEFDLRLLLML